MIQFAATVLAIFTLLMGSELWWRRHNMHEEFSRKFLHITIGTFVAFWPFFLSWGQIELLSIAFLLVAGVSKYLNLFQAIRSVQRPTWGELFFALAVGAIALVTHDKWIYLAAILQMSLADGFAAVVGVHYGRSNRYRVLGHDKSVAGTLTFLLISLVILVGYGWLAPGVGFSAGFIGITVLATLGENIGVRGVDNLLVPLVVALLLKTIS